jgi:tRNA U34 5-methylaminomethyl-2-thiouridine-forming methyltransferase MnmC
MSDNPVIQLSADGSHTIISELFKVAYHSHHGAIIESNVVFIDAGLNFILKSISSSSTSPVKVLEMGFGSGLNAFLSALWANEHKIKIEYHTVEAYPISDSIIEKLNYPDILGYLDIFLNIHSCAWEKLVTISEYFSIFKYHTTIEEVTPVSTFDLIYYDAFAPPTQPHLWEEPILKKMNYLLNLNGILVSYCAQGAFKRKLKATGFTVESVPGPPGKREMTRAHKTLT